LFELSERPLIAPIFAEENFPSKNLRNLWTVFCIEKKVAQAGSLCRSAFHKARQRFAFSKFTSVIFCGRDGVPPSHFLI
jgi:hypothetical protein